MCKETVEGRVAPSAGGVEGINPQYRMEIGLRRKVSAYKKKKVSDCGGQSE